MNIDKNTRLETFRGDLTPARLVLSLLGPPQVMVNGEVVLEKRHQKTLALLAYLAVEDHRPHRRSALAALFWPDQPERQAMQNLRKTLSRLRRVIDVQETEPAHLLVEPQTIQFNPHSDYWLDVTVFTKHVSDVQEHHHRRLEACPICLLELAQAVEYYRGSFLDGVHSVGSASFDEWLTIRREQLEQQACVALHALAKSHLAQSKPEVTCRYARRLLRLDPWNEAGHRLLLQALTLTGGRNAALIHYEIFRQELAGELGVVPEDKTVALVDQIQQGAFPGDQLRTPATRHPTPATSFVGREDERKQITGHLAGYDQRLLTISGPGGSGKSRLALEIVEEQDPLWRDGVWLISLVDVPSPDGLAGALAAALGYKPEGNLEASSLIEFLKPKEMLLILDSYEHLAADTTLIEEILRWAPHVSILVTSRVRLGIHREWVIPLDGLEIPPGHLETLQEAEKFSAVTLFLQNARRAAPDFQLTDENLPDVLRICRQVDGLPLGIELASAWVRMFTPRKIADEIEHSQDFLQKPQKKSLGRLHSLRASFNYSYNLLSEAERSLLRQLSVFRGGFTAEACLVITGKEHHHCVSLLDKSLLEASTFERLGLHLTLREYAAEQMAENPLEQTTTRMRHGAFFLAFLRDREESLRGKDQRESLNEINLEIGNILAAWSWAVDGIKLGEIKATTPGLALFYTQSSQLREGEIAFKTAGDRLMSFNQKDLETLRVAGQLRLKQADFLLRRRQLPQLKQVAQEAIELARQAEEVIGEAYGTFYQGAALWLQGEFDTALTQLERARELARKAQDEMLPDEAPEAASVEGRCLNMMAGACWNLGRFDEAKLHLEAMLPIFTRLDNQISKAAALGNLGVLAKNQGEYTQAKDRYKQALQIHLEVGNPEGQSTGYVNLGELFLSLGALEEAELHLEEALIIIRKMQSKHRETMVLSSLSQLAHYRGDDESAREYGQQAIQLAEEAGDRNRLGTAWMMLGYALLRMGRLVESAEAYQLSADLRRELNQPNLMMESLAGLARVALEQKDLAKALEITEDILELLETGSLDGTTDPFQVYLTCYDALQANDDARASKLQYSAHQQLQERAAKIGDEGLRRSFLQNIPSHRELVRSYQEMKIEGYANPT